MSARGTSQTKDDHRPDGGEPYPWRLGPILCVLVVVALATRFLGTEGGLAHFSPYTLEYRTQAEFALFAGDLPIYRSPSRPAPNRMIRFLIDECFVEPVAPEKDRWELVFHWNSAWRGGYGELSRVLVRNKDAIIEWSLADRQRAALYWSEGFRLLRSQRKGDVSAGRCLLYSGWHCESIEELRVLIASIKAE